MTLDPAAALREYVRDGLTLRYDVAGAGPDVLLAHGMTGTGDADWRRLVPALADRYRCLVPDARGHGASDFREEGFSYEALREDVRGLLAHEGAARPHLVGFSMGAEVLLDLELSYPGTAASLVLIGASTGQPPDHGFGELRTDAPPDWPGSLRQLHVERHGADHWKTLFHLIAGTWAERPELPPETLATIGCPVLLVYGDEELAFKRRQARELATVAPRARVVEVVGGGHPIHVQQADTVLRLVVDFLDEVELETAQRRAPDPMTHAQIQA